MDSKILARKLERAQAEVRELERMIESRTRDLYLSRESLRQTVTLVENALKGVANSVAVLDPEGEVLRVNRAAAQLFARPEQELLGRSIRSIVELGEGPLDAALLVEQKEFEVTRPDGAVPTLLSGRRLESDDGTLDGYVCVWVDVSEKHQLEVELRHAQKLESLGQMAAGVAHEINTPIQFVGDSLQFLQEAFEDLLGVLNDYRATRDTWGRHPELASLSAALEAAEEEADTEFIELEAPSAFGRARKGLERVGAIVKALKQFSHPGGRHKQALDLNEVVETTLALCCNEYKYVAELERDLGAVPEVLGHAGDLGQVVLNLVVNAAHAIQDRGATPGELGRIRVSTRAVDGGVLLEIEDDGAGIPDAVKERIFDPFFTTKEVGRGTGQGLSITRRIVVDGHGGRIDVDSSTGAGTTFRLFLPAASAREAA